MWGAIEAYHNTPTPAGLSPHQILFGRDPLSRGLPWSTEGLARDAKESMEAMADTHEQVRKALEEDHEKRRKLAPRSPTSTYKNGDHVWVLRPRPMGTHRTKTWWTPGVVVKRLGEDTYRVRTGPGQFKDRHGTTQLLPRVPDLRGKHVELDYTAHDGDSDDDYAEQDDHTVEKILGHRSNPQVPGGIEFRVRWRGYGPRDDSWEPPSAFVPRITKAWHQYLTSKGVPLMAKDLSASARAVDAEPLMTMAKYCNTHRVPLSAAAVALVSMVEGTLHGPPVPPCPFTEAVAHWVPQP